jgi:hypothetical protein
VEFRQREKTGEVPSKSGNTEFRDPPQFSGRSHAPSTFSSIPYYFYLRIAYLRRTMTMPPASLRLQETSSSRSAVAVGRTLLPSSDPGPVATCYSSSRLTSGCETPRGFDLTRSRSRRYPVARPPVERPQYPLHTPPRQLLLLFVPCIFTPALRTPVTSITIESHTGAVHGSCRPANRTW